MSTLLSDFSHFFLDSSKMSAFIIPKPKNVHKPQRHKEHKGFSVHGYHFVMNKETRT